MATIFDFVISTTGVDPFAGVNFRGSEPARIGAYLTARKKRPEPSKLFVGSYGSKGGTDLTAQSLAVVDTIKAKADGSLGNVGAICLFGSSFGAAAALALAAKLTAAKVTVTYLCLSDLPMFNTGYQPAVPGCGTLIPSRPQMFGGADGFLTGVKTQNVPRVKLDAVINAKVTENYYQTEGNRTKLRTAGWLWDSHMKNDEVHGAILNMGWINKELNLPDFGILDNGDVLHQKLNDHVLNNVFEDRWREELGKI